MSSIESGDIREVVLDEGLPAADENEEVDETVCSYLNSRSPRPSQSCLPVGIFCVQSGHDGIRTRDLYRVEVHTNSFAE